VGVGVKPPTRVVEVQLSGQVTSRQVPAKEHCSEVHGASTPSPQPLCTASPPSYAPPPPQPWLIMGSIVNVCPGFMTPTALFSKQTNKDTPQAGKLADVERACKPSHTRVVGHIWGTVKEVVHAMATVRAHHREASCFRMLTCPKQTQQRVHSGSDRRNRKAADGRGGGSEGWEIHKYILGTVPTLEMMSPMSRYLAPGRPGIQASGRQIAAKSTGHAGRCKKRTCRKRWLS
jgi:hypothetical protein